MPDGVDATEPKVLGARVKVELGRVGMTQAQLASHLKVDRSTVARYLVGEQTISTPMLGRIAKALGCQPEDFFTTADEAVA